MKLFTLHEMTFEGHSTSSAISSAISSCSFCQRPENNSTHFQTKLVKMTLVVDQGPWRWHRLIGHIALSSSCLYCAPVWSHSAHTSQVDMQVNSTMRLVSGALPSTPLPWLPGRSNIELPALRRKAATDKLVEKIVKYDSWPIQPDIFSPPLQWLTSRKPLWLELQPVDFKGRWRHNWKSAQVVNSHLVCDHTIQQLGFEQLHSPDIW